MASTLTPLAPTEDSPATDFGAFSDLAVAQPDVSQFGVFSDLLHHGDTAPATAEAAHEQLPDKQLIGGGTADAQAIQIVNGKVSSVPRAVAVSTTDYGEFSDLAGSGSPREISNIQDQFGVFADLVPKEAAPDETAKVVDETVAPPDPELEAAKARFRDGIPTARDILALREAQGTVPKGSTAAAPQGFTLGELADHIEGLANYVAPGFFDQVDSALSQFQIPKEAARRFIADAGTQFGGAAIESMLPEKVQTASRGLSDSAAEQVQNLTSPDNIKILGGLILIPEAGVGALVKRGLSLGFSAQAVYGMASAAEQARTEKDPQKFWQDVGNIVGQGAIATAAGVHAAGGIPEAPVRPATEPEATAATTEQAPDLAKVNAGLDAGAAPPVTEPTISQPAERGGENQPAGPDVSAIINAKPEPLPPRVRGAVLLDAKGDVLSEGAPGETHADLLKHTLGTDYEAETLDAFANDANHAFIDDAGNILDRGQAATAARANGQVGPEVTRLQSEDLKLDPHEAEQQRLEAERQRLEHEQEQRGQASSAGGSGPELFEAIKKLGGLPSPTSPHFAEYAGELSALRENARGSISEAKTGEGAQHKIFSPDAPHPDKLAEGLREQGFDIQTPADLFDAVERRQKTGQRMFGSSAADTVGSEEAADVFGFGPGAAAEGEFDRMGRKPIRIANEDIDRERAARGAEPLMGPARKANSLLWDEAMSRLDRTPQAARILVDKINDGTVKSVSDIDQAMLLHEELSLRNEKAMEAERAVDPHATEDERAAARANFDALESRIDATERAARKAGSQAGSALQARQLAAYDDYTYAALETRFRNAKGRPLTVEEAGKIKEQAAEIDRLRKELADIQDRTANESAMETLQNLMRETMKGVEAEAKAGKSFRDVMHSQRDAARARLRAKLARTSAGVDPTILYDAAVIGASHLADGIAEFGAWSKRMLEDIGKVIEPHLKELFDRSKELEAAQRKLFKPKKVKPTPIEKIASAAALSNRMVFDLARAHVQAGVTGLDAVMKAVHADLKPYFPGLSVREVRDMFSDYGKVKFPSKAEDLVKLRDYRRQAQLVSAVEDAQSGLSPKRTGSQRDRPSDRVLELQKQVQEEMKKSGITTAGDPTRLKTNLDRYKAMIQRRIAEAERRIRENDYSKPDRKRITQLDDEANRAAGKYALLKRQIDIEARKLVSQREAAQTPTYKKIIRSILDVPRSLAIGFHGTVGMITHAGAQIFRPSGWFYRDANGRPQGYWVDFVRQFKLAASEQYHEQMVGSLVRNPNFLTAKRAGLANDPAITYTDYGHYSELIEKVLRLKAGKRGFDALKLRRQAMFDRFWKSVPDYIKNDPEAAAEMAKTRAATINHSTGVITRSQDGFLSKGASFLEPVLFAAKLEASRWARIIGDPIKTVDTAFRWNTATAGEKSVAIERLKGAAEFTAFYMGTLLANQALQSALGGSGQINFTDPTKPDWLKHKIAGHTVMLDGGLLYPLRLIGLIVAKDLLGDRKALHGDTRTVGAVKDAAKYFVNKVNPTLALAKEQLTGEDFSGREVPFSLPKLFGAEGPKVRPGREPLSVTEYLLSHGPIPGAGASQVIYDEFRRQGMSAPDAATLMKGAAALMFESTGARVAPDYAAEDAAAPAAGGGAIPVKQSSGRRRRR